MYMNQEKLLLHERQREAFSDELIAIITRAAIQSNMPQKGDPWIVHATVCLSNIWRYVVTGYPFNKKEIDKWRSDARQIADLLTSHEFVIHPTVEKIGADIYAELQKDQYLKDLPHSGIILLGSSIDGALVRDLFALATHNRPHVSPIEDLDFGIIVDKKVPTSDTEKTGALRELMRNVPYIARRHKFGGSYGSAHAKSGVSSTGPIFVDEQASPLTVQLVNLKDAHDAYMLLQKESLTEEDYMYISQYFYPSIPKELNEKNRAHMFEALRRISRENHKKWKELTDNITLTTGRLRVLKPKYFLADRIDAPLNERSEQIMNNLIGLSEIVLAAPIRNLLLSTDESKEKNI